MSFVPLPVPHDVRLAEAQAMLEVEDFGITSYPAEVTIVH